MCLNQMPSEFQLLHPSHKGIRMKFNLRSARVTHFFLRLSSARGSSSSQMIKRISAAMLVLFAVCAHGQEMIKINVLEIYEHVPLPPANVQAAFARHECKEENTYLRCNAEKFYQPIVDEQNALGMQFEKLNLVLNTPAPAAVQTMAPDEIRKKMETMSVEEKMQFAMAMTQQMGFGSKALTPESEEVIAAQEEYSRLNERIAGENLSARFTLRVTELKTARARKHDEVEAWYAAEHKKIPLVSYDEAGKAPEPKAEYALKQAAMNKHFAVENEYLQTLLTHWPEEIAFLKTLYMPFQQKLAAINYGEDAENIETKRTLAGGQQIMFGASGVLPEISRAATEEAAQWQLRKLELEKQKPL